MSTPIAESFLAAFRDFEMSSVRLLVDIDIDGSTSTWYAISLLNPNMTAHDGLPMTVDLTIRPADLARFADIMLWDVGEIVAAAQTVRQGHHVPT